jgi:ferredoxin-NADP reductase
VRVGGSFTFPPCLSPSSTTAHVDVNVIKRLVFVAGGVGINPLMSMLSSIYSLPPAERTFSITFLYSVKCPQGEQSADKILFLDRLASTFHSLGREEKEMDESNSNNSNSSKLRFSLFLTGSEDEEGEVVSREPESNHPLRTKFKGRRLGKDDLIEALGPVEERGDTLCYICGVASMTDELVAEARAAEGMSAERVLCEKWW